ncbi:MAG: DUF1456 family protein [Candidatus Sabulitectum sp.]|nr:DUF1456 family protein [Candidatus Sabulitectum sp.]
MLNNDVFRRVRYALDLSDSKMVDIFKLAGEQFTVAQISQWLAREDDPGFEKCRNAQFSAFLNGLIVDLRGPREDSQPQIEQSLTNNMIFKKLRIALNLQTDDILEMMELTGFSLSRHELSSLFRKSSQRHYRECNDQTLRKFLKGMQLKYRPSIEEQPENG